jgi:TPR repeat protein
MGNGEQVDYERALEMFQRVAYHGFAAAQFNLGIFISF